MNGYLLSAFLVLAGSASAQSPSETEAVISLTSFKDCGFISRFSPNKIDPQCFQNLQNAILDQDLSILRRNGYATYNATPCTGMQSVRALFPFYATDGSQYLVIQSSGSMFSSKGDGLCTPIPGLAGLSLTAQMSCTQGLGYLWCTDGVDPVFQTNVVTTATVASAPIGKYIGFFRNRIVISNVNANLTSVYLSGELNGTDWSLPTVTLSTSPAIIRINGVNDGLGVKCLMGEYQNGFYIGRDYDLWVLQGYDLRDFSLRRVSDQIGCMDQNSTQEVNNALYWLSHRGVEQLTGTQINWASYPIDPTIKTIITAAGNSQSQTFTSQSDWQAGNLTASGPGAPISATISPGNIVPSTWTITDQSSATVGAIYSFTSATSGSVSLAQIITVNPGFENGTFGGWTATGGFSIRPNIETANCPGNYSAGITTASMNSSLFANFRVYDGVSGAVLISKSAGFGSQVPCNFGTNIDVSTLTATTIKIGVESPDGSQTLISNSFNRPQGFVSIIGGKSGNRFYFDLNQPYYSSSGTYTSATFDTSFSTPVWGIFYSSYTASVPFDTRINFQVQTATSSSGVFTSAVSVSTGSNIVISSRRFIRYISTFSSNPSELHLNGVTPLLGSVTLNAATTGYYITPCVTAIGNTGWGIFSVNAVTNGGSFTFYMSTSGVSCAQAINPATANWTVVTPNSIPAITVSSYTAVRALFSVDVATQVPLINDITVNWNAGASRPPVASSNYQDKYWLFYTTSSAVGASNDHAVIFDQNQHWQLYDDQRAASAAIYLNSLYIGDAQATGTVYLMDTGSSDAGGNFNFAFTTPDMDGGDPLSPKQFSRAYVALSAPSATTDGAQLNCNYSLNGSSTTYSLGTVDLSESTEQSGYFVAKLPFPSGQPTTGQWINLSCSNVGSVGPIRLYAIRLVYTPTSWP